TSMSSPLIPPSHPPTSSFLASPPPPPSTLFPYTTLFRSLTEQAQAGSAFKPYVLATGLTNNISLNSTFDGNSPQRFDGIEGEIQNDSNKPWGEVDLIESTKHSVNTSFVELTEQVRSEEHT